MKAIETMIRKYYRLNHFPTELFMTEFIDFADEDEPATASDAYLAKLADYRRRLMMLRDELSRLNVSWKEPSSCVSRRRALFTRLSGGIPKAVRNHVALAGSCQLP